MKYKGINCHAAHLIFYLILIIPLNACSPEKPEIAKKPEQDNTVSSAKQPSGAESGWIAPAPPGGEKPVSGDKEEKPTGNNPPAVEKARLQFETTNNGDLLKVIAEGKDKDGDAVTLTYEWAINTKPAGSADSISGFKRGDKVSVKITPFDGKDYGRPKTLTTEIRNTTPKIIEDKKFNFDGKVWSYQIKATDPDGDTLSYSLKSGPSGMTIDNTGLIKWNVPPDFKGKVPVTVSVTDGHGGEALYNFDVTIGFEGR